MAADKRAWYGRHWKKLGIGCVGVVVLVAAIVTFVVSGAGDFQRDADVIRLQHLAYYGALIQEYREGAGRYPLQGREEVPVYVHVAHGDQLERPPMGPPYEHVVVPFGQLVEELEAGLGRPVEERYDPQLVATHRPNFYLYMVAGDTYYFAVHLDRALPFAKRVSDHYFKVEISSHPNSGNGAFDPRALFNMADFRSQVARPLTRDALFRKRERKYAHYTKQPLGAR